MDIFVKKRGPPVIALNWLFYPAVSLLPGGRYCSLTSQSKPTRVFGCPKKCESRTYFTVFKFMRLATRQTMDQSDVETKSQKDSSILGCRAKLPCDVFHHLLMKLSDTMKERRRSRLSLDSGMIVVIFIRWVATVLNITCIHELYSSGWSLSYSSGRHWH